MEYYTSVLSRTLSERQKIEMVCRRGGLKVIPSVTNFFLIATESEADADVLYSGLLSRGVFVRRPAHPPLRNCVRISIPPLAEVPKLCAVLKDLLELQGETADAPKSDTEQNSSEELL